MIVLQARTLALLVLAACGASSAVAPRAPAPRAAPASPEVPGSLPAPEAAPPRRLLAIDWDTVPASNDAEALALWRTIAPSGADWEAKLDEIPSDKPVARALAIALLHEGSFACAATGRTQHCATLPFDIAEPRPDSTLAEPCLRRLLALWAIDQLEPEDLPKVKDALRAILALPPPESELVAAALAQIPEADQDERLRMLVVAWTAGQRDLVAAGMGTLDEAHLLTAARKHHIDGAVEVLSAEAHRAVYLAAIADAAMLPKTRAQAIIELAALTAAAGTKLPADARAAFVAAARSPDCTVAAHAARALDHAGDHRFVPRRPRARTAPAMLRSLCVLASFERLQHNDEDSLLGTYLPPGGLELVKISFDALGEVDTDGDGDPHTEHTNLSIARQDASLPELDDLIPAMQHCTGSTCLSEEREYRFTFRPATGRDTPKTPGLAVGELLIARIEVAERPPCHDKP